MALAEEIERDTGAKVVERQLSVHEMVSAAHEGRFMEFFGAATTSNIQPVSQIVHENEVIELSGKENHNVTNYLNRKIASIMSGPADHKWITSFE